MMRKIRFVVFVVFGFLFAGQLNAQQSLSASGSIASGTGGTVSYTVGQSVYNMVASSSGKVEQGVQHSNYITPLYQSNQIRLSIYPNPSPERITLDIADYNNQPIEYQLTDRFGRALRSGKIGASRTSLSIGTFLPGIYMMYILQDGKRINGFKIIKL